MIPDTSNYITLSKRPSNSSPILIPVQTPTEDAPMTPLYLNSQNQEYFDMTEELDEDMDREE